MDPLLLARWQFGITTVYHFLFVPLTLGLSILLAIIHTKYYRTNDLKYKTMAKFWGKLFIINFIMGVATGLVQEFQFGMNWSEYSRFMGDIFGVPLAIEALAAFFVESTFLGVWVFGWDRLPKKVHLASIWLVAIATNLSAFWILVANSFMQNPVGYVLNNGRVEMDSFFEVVTNPYVFTQFGHTFTAGVSTAAFFMLGISAYHLVKHKDESIFSSSFKLAAVAALIGSLAVASIGHFQGQFLAEEKPMKMAAMEALWETTEKAPLALWASIDVENRTNNHEIAVPYALSFMAFNSFTKEVQGINDVQAQYEEEYGSGNYIPDVVTMFWSFRIMVAAGSIMVLLAMVSVFIAFKNKMLSGGWVHKFLMLLTPAIALPYLANSFGWLITEMGRQPWIVFGLQKTADGVSTVVSSQMVLLSMVGFTLIYLILAVIDVQLLVKFAKGVDEEAKAPIAKEEGSLWI
ncbi:cytochrome bd-I ubiquinol oxidase subunit 1 apoprotein [Desulfonispora thiosulfatigenes DSM 11270]|uniref:Cytochrome bd-I ubiquinol oxidase subunit 1 apoprotein n=1 Tax=Desulfonispora thiosulfatigenes DSM 11270 TaxID=656914 RepID=A0A1W1UFY7_DESTI|nr:cytochrome ubiquinol oxidase subunit I [Desulfonispora thiosulfatigenes]SMB79943.1 cytochrome bd-I ubiquinol oxidase subunit 1 apoprotein [Desulfonispora thiosulfatigenes DSM 11270]